MLQNTNKKNNRRTNHKKSGPGKRISKTRQARMREERLKSTFHFGVKLIILLAVVIGCAQLFFYGKNNSFPNGFGTVIQALNSKTQSGKDSEGKPDSQMTDDGGTESEKDGMGAENSEKPGKDTAGRSGKDEKNGSEKDGASGQAEDGQSGQTDSDKTGPGGSGQSGQIEPWQTGPAGPGQSGMAGPWLVGRTGPGQNGQDGTGPSGPAGAGQSGQEVLGPVSQIGPGQSSAAGQTGASGPAGVNGQSVSAPGATGAVTSGELFPVSGPVDPSKPMIAFTFDDGPLYKVDQRILGTLEAYGGRGTFFIVGSRAENYKDTLNMIHNSGSEIGNHSFNHQNLEKISREEVVSQIEMTNDAVEAITGFRPKLVRVPYGAFKGQVPELVTYPMIQWNIDTEDWSNKDKDTIVSNVLSRASDGSIVLMHDLYSTTADALEEIIPQLAAQGYQFVTVSEMYAAKGVPLEAGQVYFNIHNGS